MGKKRDRLIKSHIAEDAKIRFEPLEPRLLLSGSWGTGVDSPGPITPPSSQIDFIQETASPLESAGAIGSDVQHKGNQGAEARVDILAQAAALDESPETETRQAAAPTDDQRTSARSDTPTRTLASLGGTESSPDLQTSQIDEAGLRELVFINADVADYELLITDLQESADNRIHEVVVLEADREGIQQVSDILTNQSDLAAVHFITHGAEGQIRVGSSWLNAASLQQNSNAIAGWGNALTETGDILFYGCNIAAGSTGQTLLDDLSELTGAEVAASDDPTGNAKNGGDWKLEFTAGKIESEVALSAELQDKYRHTLATYTVSTLADSGAGSLRQAITDANANGDADVIAFSVTGTINLSSKLPDINSQITIDGSTAPGYAGTPIIVLDGSGAGAVDGLTLAAGSDGSILRGLVINQFEGDGIKIDGSDGNTITGNYIGTDSSGMLDQGNGVTGIFITNGASSNTIGGLTAGERNIISGNDDDGLKIEATAGSGNTVIGNYIGLDASGASALGNGGSGVDGQADGSIIGGTASGARNIISDNTYNGVVVSGDNNTIQGNYIGTDVTGTVDLGNERNGVWLNGSSNNLIGGTDAGAGNLIAFNALDGVNIDSGSSNAVLGNQIHSNGGLGIDLGSGANSSQNAPVLATAEASGSQVLITGGLASTANDYFRIEFFASAGAGNQTYLGFANVATDGSGNASINATLAAHVTDGTSISATATKSDAGYVTFSDSSEFAANIAAVSANDAPVVSGIAKSGYQDRDIVFLSSDFTGAFSDIDGDTLKQVRITSLPANGTLNLSGINAGSGDIIPIGQLGNLTFTPNERWTGSTHFAWEGYDGASWSTTSALVSLSIETEIFGANDLGKLYRVNAATGAYTYVDDLSFSVYGLAKDPTNGVLYYTESTSSNARLGSYDPSTSTNTILGGTGIPDYIDRLAFRPEGTLIAMTGGNVVYSLDKVAGASTVIGTVTDAPPNGDVTFGASGEMYLVADGAPATGLYTIDYNDLVLNGTTSATLVGTLTPASKTGNLSGVAYVDGSLYVATAGGELYVVDPSDASILSTLNTGAPKINDLAAQTINLNEAPTLSPIADQVIDEDNDTGSLAFTIGDTETDPSSLIVTASSSDQTLIPNGNLVLGGTGANRTITVTPASDQNGGPVTISVTVSDGVNTTLETFDVTVNPVNDAPVLDNSGAMTLANVAENTTNPAGDTVAAVIASAGGDRITDVDAGAVEGIAVTGVDDTNGTWQYKVGAGSWTAFGTVSDTAAVVLDAAALVRFVPTAGYSGSAGNLTFRAWDTTDGNPCGTAGVNVSGSGGAAASSTEVETATLTVVADAGKTLWITTEQDMPAPSGWNGLAAEGIDASELLSLGGSNLALEPGTGATDGTFSRMVDLAPMVIAGASRINALHVVGSNMTVGSNAISLSKGDVLFSLFEFGTTTLQNSDLTTVDAQRNDIVLFHPDSPGNYTAGTFSVLVDGADLGFNSLGGFTLVEQSTTVGQGGGATTLDAGDILFVDWDGIAADAHIQHLQPGTLGDTTTGAISVLVDGNDLSSDFSLHSIVGIDLVEEDTAIGGTLLRSGQILLTLPGTDDIGGVSAGEHDIVVLDVTTTGVNSVASATLLFDGSDVGLDAWQEDIRGLSLSASKNHAPVFIEDGVGYWQFDEGSGTTTDDSAYDTSSGTLGSTAGADASDPTWTTGKFGQALQFDGVDDYVEIADAPELDISGSEFSASLWMKPDSGPNIEDMLFMKGDRQGNINYYLSWKDTGKMTWAFKDSAGWHYLDMDVTLPTVDEWNHVAIVFARPDVSLYINGTEYTYNNVATGGSMDRDLTANNEVLWIGAGRSGGSIIGVNQWSGPFSGVIDEVAIYNRALTAAEIETIRISQPAAATADTFTIDENSANTTVVGTVAASDQDAGDTLSYTITAGNTGGAFAIDANGTITVADSSVLDHETNPVFTLTIQATDDGAGSLSDTTTVTINLNDINDVPVAAANTVTTNEDTAVNFAATDFTYTDVEGDALVSATISNLNLAGGTLTHSSGTAVSSGDTLTAAQLDTLIYTPAADANGTPLATFDFTVNDSGAGVTAAQMSINVTAVNDVPVARPDRAYMSFDGNDYIQVADAPSLQMPSNVTMEAWINHSGSGSGSQIIVNKEGEYEMGITADTGEIKWAIADTVPSWTWHNTGYFVTAGEWTHVAVTYDGVAGEVNTYINGTLVETFAQSGAIGDVYGTYNELRIGGRENATTQRFQGQIADVRIWSTTRTQGEIQSHMNDLVTGSETGLSGNWLLNEGGGGTAFDQSVFGNDGTLGGIDGASGTPAYQGYFTNEDSLLSIPAISGLLANDDDVDGDPLSITNVDTTGMTGILALNTVDGSFTYDPRGIFDALKAGEHVIETFTYTSNDGNVDSNPVTVSITITGVNDVPVAIANTVTTNEDNAYSFSASDFTFTDTEGNGLVSATLANLSLAGGTLTRSGGTAVNSGDTLTAAQLDTLVYTPAANVNGAPLATFDFTVNDVDAGAVSAQMVIHVTAVNDVPVATANTVTTSKDNAYHFGANDFTFTDVEGNGLVSASLTNLSLGGGALTHSGGTVVNSGDTLTVGELNTLVYTPPIGVFGTPLATFDFVVNDADAGAVSAKMSINVNEFNLVPVATANTVTTAEDNMYAFTSADFTYSDVEGDALTSASLTNLSLAGGTLTHGGAVMVNSGDTLTAAQLDTLVYAPAANASGTPLATFDFTVNDSGAGTASAQMGINVTAVNDVPVASTNTVTTAEDSAYAFSSADFTFSDVEGDNLQSATITNLSLAGGTLTHSGGGALNSGDTLTAAQLDTLIYTPTGNANGSPLATFDFTVSDGDPGTVSAQMGINITAVNDAPVIGGDETGSVTEDFDPDADTKLETSGALIITDADAGEAGFVAGTVNGAYGDLSIDAAGSWHYVADNRQVAIQALGAGDSLIDTLTVRSADGTFHDIVVTINGTNDVPVTGGVDTGSVTEEIDPDNDGLLEAAGLLTITDADGGEDQFVAETIIGSYGSLTIDAGGSWIYEADNAQAAIQTLGAGDSLTDTLTVWTADGSTRDVVVTINGTDDVPVIGGTDTGSVTEEIDPDGDGLLEAAGSLMITDTDTDEGQFVAGAIGGSYGNLTIDTAGNWNYEADNNQAVIQALGLGNSLTDTLTVTTDDSTTHSVTITINGAEDAPLAVNDTVSGDPNTIITGNVLTNDTDTDSDALTVNLISGPAHGSLNLHDDGSFSYTPEANWSGIDRFTYNASDAVLDSNEATVSLTVTKQTETINTPAPHGSSNQNPYPASDSDPNDSESDPEQKKDRASNETEPDPFIESNFSLTASAPDGELPMAAKMPGPGDIQIFSLQSTGAHGVARSQGRKPVSSHPATPLMASDNSQPEENQTSSVGVMLPNYVDCGNTINPRASRTAGRMTFTAAELISNIAFAQELDLIGKQIDDQLSLEQHQGKLVIGAAAGFGTSFLVGYVFWALRGVSLLLSALASIPMWRCFDPLPVLSGFDKKRADVAPDKGGLKEAEDDEKPVQDLFILEQDLASDPKAGRK